MSEAVELGVLVLMPTFNHGKFINEAIEGVLMQKTNFPVELYISDDASTDETFAVCLKFKNSNNITLNLKKEKINIGAHKNGKKQREYAFKSKFKYIAICEGDDYWTDPYKLQKQVDFLEENLEYVGSVHNSIVYYQETSIRHQYLELETDREISSDESLISLVGLTPSFVFRNKLTFYDLTLMNSINFFGGDRMLFVLLSRFGKFYYHKDIMCCYRKHSNGMTSEKNNSFYTKDEIKILQLVKKKFSIKSYPGINKALLLVKIKLANQLAENKSIKFISPLISSFFNINNYQSLKIFIKDGLLKSFKVLFIK